MVFARVRSIVEVPKVRVRTSSYSEYEVIVQVLRGTRVLRVRSNPTSTTILVQCTRIFYMACGRSKSRMNQSSPLYSYIMNASSTSEPYQFHFLRVPMKRTCVRASQTPHPTNLPYKYQISGTAQLMRLQLALLPSSFDFAPKDLILVPSYRHDSSSTNCCCSSSTSLTTPASASPLTNKRITQ
jgi:hypothetical protein